MDIPLAGFGTYKISNEDCERSITTAVEVGYRHFDFASFYCNQEAIGAALRKVLQTHKRDEFFFTSKIWPTEMGDVRTALEKTLAQLGLSSLDLYLVHWPLAFDAQGKSIPMQTVWRQMEEVQRLGLTRLIGISNFTVPMILDLLSYAAIEPYCNQIEVNVFEHKERLIKYCQSRNIKVVSYRPIGSSFSTLEADSFVCEAARKRKCTIPQLVCKYFQQKYEIVLLAKSAHEAHIRENFAFAGIEELSEQEISHLDGLSGRRTKSADGVEAWGFNVFE